MLILCIIVLLIIFLIFVTAITLGSYDPVGIKILSIGSGIGFILIPLAAIELAVEMWLFPDFFKWLMPF